MCSDVGTSAITPFVFLLRLGVIKRYLSQSKKSFLVKYCFLLHLIFGVDIQLDILLEDAWLNQKWSMCTIELHGRTFFADHVPPLYALDDYPQHTRTCHTDAFTF